jgi:hypothetical protein
VLRTTLLHRRSSQVGQARVLARRASARLGRQRRNSLIRTKITMPHNIDLLCAAMYCTVLCRAKRSTVLCYCTPAFQPGRPGACFDVPGAPFRAPGTPAQTCADKSIYSTVLYMTVVGTPGGDSWKSRRNFRAWLSSCVELPRLPLAPLQQELGIV